MVLVSDRMLASVFVGGKMECDWNIKQAIKSKFYVF